MDPHKFPEAKKFDEDKVPLHLIDPLWLDCTAHVLAVGVKKYGAWNWAKGTFEWHRLYRAAIGHLNAWYGGEDNDPETGLSHIWHANCCLMFLTRYAYDGMGTDDRPKFPERKVGGYYVGGKADDSHDANAKPARPFVTNTPRPGTNDPRAKTEPNALQAREWLLEGDK